jgi:MFS family permease
MPAIPPSPLSQWLRRQPQWVFSLYCITAAFLTYCSMYAFRKPFTAAEFEGLELWGVEYKIILIVSQVIGYMLSKFWGIKVVSEMTPERRIRSILLLIGSAWVALLLLGIIPFPYNFVALFFNGLPLGMIWGIVFSFLEGRKSTELLGAGMSASFIVSSGIVKAVGQALMVKAGITAFWMPFVTGLLFVPLLLLGVWMLRHIPPPTAEDEALRTERIPMDGAARRAFWRQFAPGIVLMVAIYIALTIFRDLRDNFAVELWAALGYADQPEILAVAELPIAISVLIIIGLMMFLRNNRIAFYANHGIILLGGGALLLTTWLFDQGWLDPAAWMILVGFGMYLAYIAYHTMLFERWIALFRYPSNIGYLMYVADAFGYLGSVAILFFKNFGAAEISWLTFFNRTAYVTGGATLVLGGLAIAYFLQLEKRKRPSTEVAASA